MQIKINLSYYREKMIKKSLMMRLITKQDRVVQIDLKNILV